MARLGQVTSVACAPAAYRNSVTNDFNITEYIFTVTQDNAAPNNRMLEEFEVIVGDQRNAKPDNLQ